MSKALNIPVLQKHHVWIQIEWDMEDETAVSALSGRRVRHVVDPERYVATPNKPDGGQILLDHDVITRPYEDKMVPESFVATIWDSPQNGEKLWSLSLTPASGMSPGDTLRIRDIRLHLD